MEKNIIKLTVVFLLLSITCTVSAQFTSKSSATKDLTTYEKKRYELANQTISEMCDMDMSLSLYWLMALKQAKDECPFVDFMQEVYFTEEFIETIGVGSSFGASFTDDLIEYISMSEMKEIYNRWKRKRTSLDKTMTANDKKREKTRKQKQAEIKKQNSEIRLYITRGDEAMSQHLYDDAKYNYESALQIAPDDEAVKAKLANVAAAIETEERQRKEAEAERLRVQAEQERQRREAEEKARREKEIRNVESLVGNNIAKARSNRETGQLQAAAVLLQEGIDATISHNHDYRKEEMAQLLDTIRQLQSEVSDTSKVLDYKRFRPDLYEATDIRLTNRIQNYLTNRDKREKHNNISFTLNTFSQPGVFQIEKSSRALKEFCNTTVAVEKLQPLIIDESQVKAQASFNYTFEYASGTVKVKQKDALRRVNVKFDVSPDLEQKISTEVTDKMSNLSSWEYSGRYKFHVTSMDINGQTHHTMILKKVHLYNGPQNFLRSLIVPGWGDKYVEADRKFDWWKTVISYGATAAGTGVMLYSNKMKKASETIHYEKVVTGYNSDGTPIYYDRPVSNSNSNNGMYAYYSYIGYGLIAVGVGMWLYDVIYVGVKGTKNKNEEKAQMGWYLTYDVANNAPEVGYSLRF